MPTLKTVVLDSDKCIGCITCMRRCPTEAIRIENGKAKILYEKCINCGECVRSCKGGAKRPVYDSFDLVASYGYKIALPSPSLFGQFNNLDDPNYVIEGLLALGFDEVFEVGLAAELVTDCTKKLMKNKDLVRPVVSTACPAVAELIDALSKKDLKEVQVVDGTGFWEHRDFQRLSQETYGPWLEQELRDIGRGGCFRAGATAYRILALAAAADNLAR